MNHRLLSLVVIPALAASVLVGCAKPTVVGKWQAMSRQRQNLAATFDLKPDNTMTQTVTTPIGPITVSGTWKTESDQLTLNATDIKLKGQPLPPMFAAAVPKSAFNSTATFKLDGDTLTLTTNGKSLPLTRVKDEAAK